MLTNQQIFFAILLLFIGYLSYTYLIDTNNEYFENNNQIDINSNTEMNQNNTITNETNTTNEEKERLQIVEYYTEDGGVTVAWKRPKNTVDYMAIIKDKDGEEVKMFFKDTISADCNNDICRYSFQNLINDRNYSLVLSTISKSGISEFSNQISFSPTYQTMKCNANGTCSLIKSVKKVETNDPLNNIMENTNVTKEVLSKCQNMIEAKDHIYDINQIYETDGSFKSVKDKLQYPEHLLLPIKKGPDSLAELVKHQLELGVINVNVHNKDIADAIKKEKELSDLSSTLNVGDL